MVKQWVGGSKCRLMQDTLFSIFNVLNGNGTTICNINVATVNGFHYHSSEALCWNVALWILISLREATGNLEMRTIGGVKIVSAFSQYTGHRVNLFKNVIVKLYQCLFDSGMSETLSETLRAHDSISESCYCVCYYITLVTGYIYKCLKIYVVLMHLPHPLPYVFVALALHPSTTDPTAVQRCQMGNVRLLYQRLHYRVLGGIYRR